MLLNGVINATLAAFQHTSLLFLLTISLIILSIIVRKKKNYQLVTFANKFPGPTTIPYFGNSLELIRGGTIAMKKIREYTEIYGDAPYKLWIGTQLFIVLTDPELLKAVFVNENALDKPKVFNRFQDTLGHSLFTSSGCNFFYISTDDGEYWRTNRKKLSTVFKVNNLQSYIPIVQTKVHDIINNHLKQHAIDGTQVDMGNYLSFLFFMSSTKTMMDLELSFKEAEDLHFSDQIKITLQDSNRRMHSPWAHNDWINAILFPAGGVKKAMLIMSEFIQKATDIKIQDLLVEEKSQNQHEKDGNTFNLYFKLVYKQSEHLMHKKRFIHEHMISILAGATDTVATTTSYCLMMLGIYPDIQDKVHNELCEVFGNELPDLDMDKIKRLKYLDQVVKETLRRFTLVPYIHRLITEEMKIGEHTYPAGTNIMISLFGAHYNRKYYPDPWKFNPENFSQKAINGRPKYTLIPFAAGPRNCIGFAFAELEVKIALILLIWTFNIHVDMTMEDIDKHMGCDFVTYSNVGYPAKLELRE